MIAGAPLPAAAVSVDAHRLVDGHSLAGAPYRLVARPVASQGPAGIVVGGGDLVTDGHLDADGRAVLMVPQTSEGQYFTFGLPDVGAAAVWPFEVPAAGGDLHDLVDAFHAAHPEGTISVRHVPTPGPEGPPGEPSNVPGPPGRNAPYRLEIYRAALLAPDRPMGGTYTVAADTIVAPAGWHIDPQIPGDQESLWFSTARISGDAAGVVVPVWSSVGEAGSQGPPGPPGAGVYLGAWDNLNAATRAAVDLGQYALRYGRYWIVHERDRARLHGPLDTALDGWRPVDGQHRGVAPAAVRVYDLDDHVEHDGGLWFCRVAGEYGAAEIVAGPNWWDVTGGGVTPAQLAAEAQAREAADTALGGRIDNLDPGPGGGVTPAQLAAEAQARAEGDTALGGRIDDLPEGATAAQLQAEAVARGEGDTALGGRIDDLPDTDAQLAEEALQRSQADVALGGRIDAIPPPGINLGQAVAAAREVSATWSHADNQEPIPAEKLTEAGAATARTEVLVPFRPGSDPAKILIQSIGFVALPDGYSEYAAPRYISDGGFTLAVIEAHDFAAEPHLVSLLAGGAAPAAGPIVSGDNPALGAALSNSLIWEPTTKRFSRLLGHSAVPQVVDWGETALPPGHVFEAGKSYVGIAESRTDLPHVLSAASVWFLRNSNTYTTGTTDGHAAQYVPPGDLGAFGFKDQASNAVTADGQYAAFVDPDTGNSQIFPWQVQSFVAKVPAEWHLDPYVTSSLLPPRSTLTEITSLIFPALMGMQNGRVYRFNDLAADDIRDTDEWFVEWHAADGKTGSSDNYSGLLWNELVESAFSVQSNGDVSTTTGTTTDDTIGFLAGRGSTGSVDVTGGLNTAMYIFRRQGSMWIACPHWGTLFSSLLDTERVMRVMRRR